MHLFFLQNTKRGQNIIRPRWISLYCQTHTHIFLNILIHVSQEEIGLEQHEGEFFLFLDELYIQSSVPQPFLIQWPFTVQNTIEYICLVFLLYKNDACFQTFLLLLTETGSVDALN